MESMKNMAVSGRLVISVIHQPRSSIYDMFDKLYLLSEGKTIYQGKASEATSYFATLGELIDYSHYFINLVDRRLQLSQVV